MQESPRETERERERNGNKEREEKKAWSREYHIFEVMFLSEAVALGLFCIMYEKIFVCWWMGGWVNVCVGVGVGVRV